MISHLPIFSSVRQTAFVVLFVSVGIGTALAESAADPEDPADNTVYSPPLSVSGDPKNPGAFRRIWHWSDTKIKGVFDSILPDTQDRRAWSLSLQPRFGDLSHSDYFRMPLAFEYGFTDRLEGDFELDSYSGNPDRHGASGFGISSYSAGIKYRLALPVDQQVAISTGVNFRRPVISSPPELNEGVNRYTTFVTLARPIPCSLDIEGFVNLSYDVLISSAAVGSIPIDKPQDDYFTTGAGLLYRTGPLTYGMAVNWEHTVEGGAHDFVTLSPSLIYAVPPKLVFHSPGRWQLGAVLDAKHYSNQTKLGFRVRARWSFDFRHAYQKWRNARANHRQMQELAHLDHDDGESP